MTMNMISVLARRVIGGLFGLILLIAGLLFAASVAVAAMLLVSAVVGWNLLHGRPPALRCARRQPVRADVVDVQAREVPDASTHKF